MHESSQPFEIANRSSSQSGRDPHRPVATVLWMDPGSKETYVWARRVKELAVVEDGVERVDGAAGV